MTSLDRFHQWVSWWQGRGELAGDGGPRRPRGFSAHQDGEIGRAALIVARVIKERGR